jgi:TonB family protein
MISKLMYPLLLPLTLAGSMLVSGDTSRGRKAPGNSEKLRCPDVCGCHPLNDRAIWLPQPLYPRRLRQSGESGRVIVRVIVGEDGHVIKAKACSKDRLLNKACEEAAYKAVIKPTLLSGVPVKVRADLIYQYSFKAAAN